MHLIARPIAAALLALLSLLHLAAAQAQGADTWPNRPITLVVPAAAGAGTDLLARELATRLSVALKQNVIVDNKPGGSGIPATTAVVRAAPDGYTLLYTNGSFTVMAPALLKSMPYDVTRDITPIAQTAVGGVLRVLAMMSLGAMRRMPAAGALVHRLAHNILCRAYRTLAHGGDQLGPLAQILGRGLGQAEETVAGLRVVCGAHARFPREERREWLYPC